VRLLLLALLLLAAPVSAQRVVSYVEQGSGSDQLALGYPVPLPQPSLQPVDGFRDYASLMARLHGLALDSGDLRAVAVGQTHAGRTVWAFVASTAGDLDPEGLPKPAFYLNGTTHAREWGIPELAAGTIEWLLAGAQGAGIERYLLDHTRLVIVPVQNVDGFLQTQRYPAQAVLGTDPYYPNHWPRDGRMRRKNMRGVDENLDTFADHLRGVDLNRNHLPFWASSTQSSFDVRNLVYHGPAAQSEPEVQAMLAALELAPRPRLRLGIDLHSYTQVFFASNTGDAGLLEVQNTLLQRLAAHHADVSRSARFPTGRTYRNVPDPPGFGIGAAAEYFAYEFAVPAWTLEIEPGDGAGRDYGGTGVTHSGFILPASEVRRVADAWAQSHQVAFYFMAGPPHLVAVTVERGGQAVLRSELQTEGGVRQRQVPLDTALLPGQSYRLRVSFSRPMRLIDADGAAGWLPGLPRTALQPVLALLHGDARIPLSSAGGRWLRRGEGARRYDGDAFELDFALPADLPPGQYRLEVEAEDLVGHRLDPQPETPVDWVGGAWQGWEGGGGPDAGIVIRVASQSLLIRQQPQAVGEGDTVRVLVERPAPAQGPLQAALCDPRDEAFRAACLSLAAAWAVDGSGMRWLTWPVPDDALVQGGRALSLPLFAWSDPGQAEPVGQVSLQVLDNDAPGQRILRLRAGDSLAAALAQGDAEGEPLLLVLDGDADWPLQAAGGALRIEGRVDIHANHASLLVHGGQPAVPALVEVLPGARLRLFDAELRGATAGDESPVQASLFRSAGGLELHRSRLRDLRLAGSAFDNAGELLLSGLGVSAMQTGGAWLENRGQARLEASSLFGIEAPRLLQSADGEIHARHLSAFGNRLAAAQLSGRVRVEASVMAGNQTGAQGCEGAVEDGGGNALTGAGCPAGAVLPGFDPAELVFDSARGGALPPLPLRDRIAAGFCGASDQALTPRPQSAAAPAACDTGALEHGIAPFRGFWIPERSGHGVDLQTAGDRLFIGWYTYDAQGQPTTYFAVAPLRGPRWAAELLSSRRDPDSGGIERFRVGEVAIDFDSDVEARLRWRFDADGIEGQEGIRAWLFDPQAPAVEITGSWYPPAESGWGASVARQGAITGLVLYYYDDAGVQRWALGTGAAGDVIDVPLLHHTGFCPNCDAGQNPVHTRPAGSARLQMLTPRQLRVWTDIAYPDAPGGSWQREAADFQPLHAPVDNRRLREVLRQQ
jgi:hypothetical protein